MSSTPTKVLFTAYERIQAGEMRAARAMLKKLLRSHPNSERGWLLLSMAVPDAARQRECLRRVLQINPANAEAKARLASLTTGPLSATDAPSEVADTGTLTAPEPNEAEAALASEEPVEAMGVTESTPVTEPQIAIEVCMPLVESEAVLPLAEPADGLVAGESTAVAESPITIESLVAPVEARAHEIEAAPDYTEPAPPSEPVPTRRSVTGLLTPPPVTSGSSPVITFEPDRPAPVTEPLNPEPALIVEAVAKEREKEKEIQAAAEEPVAPVMPPKPAIESVTSWPRMYEQPSTPATSPVRAPASTPPERGRTPPPSPAHWDLPPAPQRDYYAEEPWPRYTLPLALFVWAAVVIGVFFIIARLLMG